MHWVLLCFPHQVVSQAERLRQEEGEEGEEDHRLLGAAAEEAAEEVQAFWM